MKVLIAYDGSICAHAALDDLRRAGLPRVAEALILSVADVFLPPPSRPGPAVPAQMSVAAQQAWAQAARAVDEAHALAQHARAQILADFPAWDVQAEACADSPAWGVLKKAETWQPDVIVVGSHGRSAVGRLLLGSVSHKILTEASCAVRVGRSHRQTDTAPVRLLIGVDGSSDAAAAVQAVAVRVWPAGSEARLVTVLEASKLMAQAPQPAPGREASDPDDQAWIQQMLETMAEQLRPAGLAVWSVIKLGDPSQVLLDEAEHWGADGIFVGARGLGRVKRLLLGSVSTAVATRAHCSVEVVRPRQTS